MKKKLLALTLLVLSLAACVPTFTPTIEAHEASTPAASATPAPEATTTEAATEGRIRAPSFESQTYVDEAAGFALEYPAGWTINEAMIGSRGSQVLLLSAPEIAELAVLPEGATRVAITIKKWDPQNDLAAFVDMRKTAWEASGFTISAQEAIMLDLGLEAAKFTVTTPDGLTSAWLFAALGGQYVTLSGEGDLILVQEIMQYLRPLGAQ